MIAAPDAHKKFAESIRAQSDKQNADMQVAIDKERSALANKDLAVVKPTSQLNTPEGVGVRVGNQMVTNPSLRQKVKVTRLENTETAGSLGTRGASKETIGGYKKPEMGMRTEKALNTSTDPGRGLANAVRDLHSDDSRVLSEPALQTATKAFQGQREINLRTKAASALKGGGTALGLGSSIMGAEDAKDQYGAMQTGPNYMDLKTGKVKKRSGGGLTSS